MRQHEPLVHWVVRRQWSRGWRYADLVHEGRIGLWRALRGYDPTRGTTLATYASVAIARQVWAAVRQAQAPRPEVRLQARHVAAAPDSLQADWVWQRVCVTLWDMVQQLPAWRSWLVLYYYGLAGRAAYTQTDLGARWGHSRQAVGYHVQRALVQL